MSDAARNIMAVTLVVPDYDSAIAFYVGKLGFHLLEDIKVSATKRWVMVAPDKKGTALLLARAVNATQSAAIGAQTGGRVGFFLQTDDFARDYKKMRDAGVMFEEEPRREPYGIVAVWRDPFGNRWDLLECA